MMTTLRPLLAIASLTALMVSAVAPGAVAQSEPEFGPVLRLFNWDEYVDPDVVEGFEAESGIDVFIETFTDENEMVSVIQGDTARYDLFITSTSVVREMADQRLLAPLDHSRIPNLANVDPRYLDLPLDPGNTYSVPYDWGTTGLAYNTDCVAPEHESWGLLFEPSVAGRIAMDTDYTVVISSLLKYLGYPLNSSDPQHVAAAFELLEELTLQQGVEFIVWNEMLDRLAEGELCVVQAFNGDVVPYMEESDNIGFFVPEEGSDFYVDSFAIPRDAANKAGAEAFIDHILRPEVHAANNEYTGYAVPNRASIEGGHVSDVLLADPNRYPDVEGLEPWLAFDRQMLTVWNEAWAGYVLGTL